MTNIFIKKQTSFLSDYGKMIDSYKKQHKDVDASECDFCENLINSQAS